MIASAAAPRVLVVDDSALVRQVIADLIVESGEFRLAGMARDGAEAIAQVRALDPDIVTLDVAMPGMHGLEALSTIMRESPRAVVMLSALDDPRGGDLTIRALELGAIDFVHKPSRVDAFDANALRDRLLIALRAARGVRVTDLPTIGHTHAAKKLGLEGTCPARHVVAIASSTGGPRALSELLPGISPTGDTAILIAQHMPPGFTDSLARRLDAISSLVVREAADGEAVVADHVYVAPGGLHMRVGSGPDGRVISISEDAPVWGIRPAADPLFAAVAHVFGKMSVGVILTGMGRDGAEGLLAIRKAGGHAIVQDRDSSAVWGMPGAALELAGADDVVPLGTMASRIGGALHRLRGL
ncbi:MAG: chemotaxis-specific protein-glutamate methyltransferase CheB [Gemmatimonadaceae bacterium]